jgi:N-acetylneuraminic acid mutarotase
VILFGGTSGDADAGYPQLGDTWSWTPSGGWTELHPPASPSPRWGAMASSLGGDVVLFGGVTQTAETAETWLWNGKTWARAQPSFSPPTLVSSVLAPLGQDLVLFGGYNNGIIYHDVWQWDGTNWTHESPGTMPPAREAPAGAVVNGSLVIFGGEDVNLLPLGDTWAFDGSSWTQLSPAHSPSARRGAVAAGYDGKMVLFGGDVISPSTSDWLSVDETWVWDGTDWTQMSPAEAPPARSFAGMAGVGGEVVLFGGGNFGGTFQDPAGGWVWDGTHWTEQTGPGPSPRNSPAMTAR